MDAESCDEAFAELGINTNLINTDRNLNKPKFNVAMPADESAIYFPDLSTRRRRSTRLSKASSSAYGSAHGSAHDSDQASGQLQLN